MEPSPKEFRDAMRALVGSCSVITVGDGDDDSGLVVTSAISLSAEPPLLLACVNRSSSSHPLLVEYGRFGWSSLGAAHGALGERFSGFAGVKGAARYEGAEWDTAVTGASHPAEAVVAVPLRKATTCCGSDEPDFHCRSTGSGEGKTNRRATRWPRMRASGDAGKNHPVAILNAARGWFRLNYLLTSAGRYREISKPASTWHMAGLDQTFFMMKSPIFVAPDKTTDFRDDSASGLCCKILFF